MYDNLVHACAVLLDDGVQTVVVIELAALDVDGVLDVTAFEVLRMLSARAMSGLVML
jgi:hypothetical protein